jgi:hypothetical protein
MNLLNLKYIFLLILLISLGCKNNMGMDGNYYLCENGYYSEVYIKNDSVRAAWDTNGNDLSEWQKMKIRNDTLYFEQFGHLRDSIKGTIKYLEKDKSEFHYFIGSGKYSFEEKGILNRINGNLNFESEEEFWLEFKKRQSSADCESRTKKNAG